jgi:hypothetical protein
MPRCQCRRFLLWPSLAAALVSVAVAADPATDAPAPVAGLIYYQDFDHHGLARCGDGWAVRQELTAAELVPGRFGRACRFQCPRTNWLSANQASAETGNEGFVAGRGVTLQSVAGETRFGQRVLRAEFAAAGLLWRTTPVMVRTTSPNRPGKVFVFSVYLRADRPGAKVRLGLVDEKESGDWRAEIARAEPSARGKATQATAKPPRETVSIPGEATLTAGWQRVAARLEVDSRRPEQALAGTLEVLDGASGGVMADGLQLEQAGVYPLANTDPTSWIPGGQSTGLAWIDLPLRHTGFTGRRGTLACWVRPLADQCGGTREVGPAVTLGNSWWAPCWQLGGSRWYAGEAPTRQPKGKLPGTAVEKRLREPGGHDGWHHLALAWDEQEAASYLDGQFVARTPLAPGEPAPEAMLRLGGSFLEHFPMSGDLDEVALYSRRLSAGEIGALAEASAALAAYLPQVLVRRPVRIEFLRSEPQAAIALEVVPYGSAPAEARLSASVPTMNAALERTVRPGQAASLVIKPWLCAPGRWPLAVEVSAGGGTVRATDFVEVFEEPPTPEFIIYAWGGTDTDLQERGFNCLFGEPTALLRQGLWAIMRIDVREGVPHPWSPQTRARAETAARQVARAAMAHPNVRACLVNSEAFHPPIPAAEPWFLEWMKSETGLSRVPPEIQRNPMHVQARTESDVPPLVRDDFPPYKFLRWWTERGQGYYLLNNQIVRWMRQAGLKTAYYNDQPEVPAQFADMDLVDYWHYPKSPEGLVGRFSHASCMARLAGKPFQAMPGTVYWDDGNGLWLPGAGGKRQVLCLSPDCLTENLWISVACPSTNIGLYGIGERKTELYDRACDAAMSAAYRQISPVGVLVGGLPAEQARVAMLETDGLYFIQPGVPENYFRHWLTRLASRVLARTRLPFDWITDDHVYAGWLDRYRAVFVPGAWALPERTHRALVDYARSGGQVIADRVMRAEIPGLRRLDIETQSYPDQVVQRELGGWAASVRDALAGWASVTPAEQVFTYVRECGPSRYLLVINDHRRSGPQFARWQVMLNALGRKPLEPLRDEGLPLDTSVTVPAGFALYDVLKHGRLEATAEGRRQRLAVHLEPGGAAVLAAFPRPINQVVLVAPGRAAPGTELPLSVRVIDDAQAPVPGRQLAEIRVTSPDGQPWPGVDRYRRITDGQLSLPLRLPLTAPCGRWRVEVLEWTSGLRAVAEVAVAAN